MPRRMPALLGRLLHLGVFLFQAIRRSIWYFTRPEAVGVHGIPLTPDGKIVLVMLSYAPGWHLPGGGKRIGEEDQVAMLRELREEIGLTDHGRIDRITAFDHRPNHRRGKGMLFIVRDIVYRPHWSFEVKQVGEFRLHELPQTTAKSTRRLLGLAGSKLELNAARNC